MQNYSEVPSIISGKDLDYLSDMFNWNFNSFKLINDFKEKVSDEEIKDFVSNSNNERKPEASFLYFFKPLLSFPTSTLCDFLLIITSALSFNCNDYNFT